VKVNIPGLTLSSKRINHDKAGFFDDSGAVLRTRKLMCEPSTSLCENFFPIRGLVVDAQGETARGEASFSYGDVDNMSVHHAASEKSTEAMRPPNVRAAGESAGIRRRSLD
jgi:hypothetical protein